MEFFADETGKIVFNNEELMNRRIRSTAFIPLLAAVIFLGACGMGPTEPVGLPVELTREDLDLVRAVADQKKQWAAWHSKGTRLVKEQSYLEALYCFNQAVKAWPKNIKNEPAPADTYLQKAYLFLKMEQPRLAIRYFKKFEHDKPGNNLSAAGIREAQAMMKVKKK